MKYETCDAEADWTWYEGGQRVGMCHRHIGYAWLFARLHNGPARPVARIRENPASLGSRKSQVIRTKV